MGKTKTEGQNLESQVKGYWTRRDKNSAQGLVLVNKCIENFARHGDWDHLARFYVGALKVGQGPAIGRIIRAAFGNSVKWKVNAKHDAGGTFTKVNWPDVAFPLHESNTYSLITQAIAEGQGWDHKVFQTALKEAIGPVEKAKRVVSEESKKKVVKHLLSYTDKLKDDGFNVGEILSMLQKELVAATVTVKAVA